MRKNGESRRGVENAKLRVDDPLNFKRYNLSLQVFIFFFTIGHEKNNIFNKYPSVFIQNN